MTNFASKSVALALLAALAALVVAWFVPLPRLVLSEEEKAATRIPEDRAAVATARMAFGRAESAYKTYVATHDVGAALAALEHAVQLAMASPADANLRASAVAATSPVLDYLANLQTYAQAGETYFGQLAHYDDELMAWTRSLGTQSDALRPDTWPIVEYLKRYPPPTGETTQYSTATAADVATYTVALNSAAASLQNDRPAGGASEPAAALFKEVANVREAGRSIEYRESLNAQYEQILTAYDGKVQALTGAAGSSSLSSGRVALSTGLDVLLGAITLAGLAALFLPGRAARDEATG